MSTFFSAIVTKVIPLEAGKRWKTESFSFKIALGRWLFPSHARHIVSGDDKTNAFVGNKKLPATLSNRVSSREHHLNRVYSLWPSSADRVKKMFEENFQRVIVFMVCHHLWQRCVAFNEKFFDGFQVIAIVTEPPSRPSQETRRWKLLLSPMPKKHESNQPTAISHRNRSVVIALDRRIVTRIT